VLKWQGPVNPAKHFEGRDPQDDNRHLRAPVKSGAPSRRAHRHG